jgi:hypothetical protein
MPIPRARPVSEMMFRLMRRTHGDNRGEDRDRHVTLMIMGISSSKKEEQYDKREGRADQDRLLTSAMD